MTKEKRHSACWCLSLALPVLLLAFLSPARGDAVRVEVSGSNVSVAEDDQEYTLFSGPDVQYLSGPGEPAIPYRVVRVLLPPGADPSSVTARIEGATFEEIPGTWNVRPAGLPATWDGTRVFTALPDDRTIVDGRDIAVYGSDALFPEHVLEGATSGSMRGWRLASVPVALYRYNPVTKKLLRLVKGVVCIAFSGQESARVRRNSAPDRIASERLKALAVNYDRVAPLYGAGVEDAAEAAGSSYVIITTSSIQSALANLDRFTVNKQARGFTVQVVTESTWGGGTGNTATENIRSWLQSNYTTLNIEYVLLIGNQNPSSGDVPMKLCHPYESNCPTDYYYADLTGNWDLNGNGRYGEWGDFGSGGIDRNWDVIVGRIPYYGSTADVDAILEKIIDYENTPGTDAIWRQNILLPMVPFDGSTPMYQCGEEIKDDAVVPRGWTYHRIYSSTYGLSPPPETAGSSVDNTTNAWNASRFGAIFWATHGSSTSASAVMDLSHAATLDDAYPGFTFQGSCSNSYPEETNSLSYTLLKKGCIATVGATRLSWYWIGQTSFAGRSSIGSFVYEHATRLVGDDLTCGYALHDLKQTITPEHPAMWQNYIVFNIYGDPSLGLSTTLVDDDLDGMPDYWEITYFGDTGQSDTDDYDGDGLTNLAEYGEQTDPTDYDSDGDGLNDGDEVNTHGTDPLDDDTDDDGLNDGDEIANSTDPNDTDSDDDGLSDYEEVNTYGTNPLSVDSDSDGWCDVLEISGGSNPNSSTSTPDSVRVSFQPASSGRPDNYAPAGSAAYSEDLGYGWR